MNPVTNILTKIFSGIAGYINNVDNRTADTIRQSFFLLLFVLTLIGMYIGYKSGKESATIKSPPLAEYTKQVFDIDRSMERDEGKFGSVLESDLIYELRRSKRKKIEFPSRDILQPEVDQGVIDQNKKKITSKPGMATDNRQIEGQYSTEKKKSDIRPLKRDMKPFEHTDNSGVIRKKSKKLKPEDSMIKRIESGKNSKFPKPINKSRGIIEK